MSCVCVRYAPSPTGIPHIGNIRTALFNFLFAKNQKGRFILRIEDTDRKRLVPASIPKIKESLKVLGLLPDKAYLQSERLSVYQRDLKFLKEKGLVYEDDGAQRFRVEKGKKVKWMDLVHSAVEFTSDVIEDFVIVKSDGYPTYHFASVVDDHDMQITHVIRGDEWISSTPKHLLLYQAFGWDPPHFTHVPPILGPDRKKLSKRDGARSVLDYIKDGYLPQALVNFLALLGWMPIGDRELFSLDELTCEFSLDRLNKNSPIFNLEKLNWFNMQWMKKVEEDELARQIKKHFPNYGIKKIKGLVPLVKERMKTLKDFEKIAGFFFNSPLLKSIPEPLVSTATISKVSLSFEKSPDWTGKTIKELIEETAQEMHEDRVETITTIRNVVSGSDVTPPLYESLEKLGKEETLKRLNDYINRK